jgi:hypothetical protein
MSDIKMSTFKHFEDKYPNLCRFVEELGWIEIGENEMISAFVRAYDEGGTVYEGKDSYPSFEAALQDLDTGIKKCMEDRGI